ncbi:AraC family transcriptional regulator [Paenibacillus psychroresistens]|uniref:AraC family transcriptional regulator n=1 Tax=Paenibacillus psychroresistens TaxID=1778678 RepID=A0A6B8RT22_9BACL|nr:helix-turn-helix transcriptional regulator [Paenibacillus psychroresistens]QGQ98348.1 AraC family transcriptional regulator [Paenibacillus psychroresistens]
MSIIQFMSPPMPHYITCGEDTYYNGDSHAARNKIGVFDFILVTQGSLHMAEEEKNYEVQAGQYLLLLPDRSHRSLRACKMTTHFFWLHFQTLGSWNELSEHASFIYPNQDDVYSPLEQFSCFIPQFGDLYTPELSYSLMKQLNLLKAQPLSSDRWKQQVLFQELLFKLTEGERILQNRPHIVIAEQAASFLRENYRSPISYSQLAERLHFHPNYISLCMKRVYGCTPLEFITRYRVDQAKLLLIHTNEQIGKIAEDSGFGSFPFFIRCFTKHTGFRPKAFRMNYRI